MPLIISEERDDRAYQAKPFGGSHKCSKLIALSMSAGEVVGLRDLACDPLTGASAHKGAGSLADLRGSCISTARSAIAPGGSSFFIRERELRGIRIKTHGPGWVCAGGERPVEMPGVLVSPLACSRLGRGRDTGPAPCGWEHSSRLFSVSEACFRGAPLACDSASLPAPESLQSNC